MNVHDNIRLREFGQLRYHDPAWVLSFLRRVELSPGIGRLPEPVRSLRTNPLKRHREGRQAALFCHGLAQVVGAPVRFALAEHHDYDAVLTFVRDDGQHFWPLQLKELVPSELSPRDSIQSIIDGLAKYPDSRDLCVAIHVNRDLRGVDLSAIPVPELPIGSLWLVGGVSADQNRWALFGDLMREDRVLARFDYPQPRVLLARPVPRLLMPCRRKFWSP